MLQHLWNDLRYAARRLGKSPGFTTAAVATIALGVGINTGIFTVLNGVALRELPAPDADELVSVHQIIEGEGVRRFVSGARSMFSTSEYRAYRDGTRTLSGIMGYSRPYTAHARRGRAAGDLRHARDVQLLRTCCGSHRPWARRSRATATPRAQRRPSCSGTVFGRRLSAPIPRSSAATCS